MPDPADAMNSEEFRRDNVGLLTSDDVRIGLIGGVTFTRRAVQYAVVDGRAVFEGDIVLGTVEELERDTAELAAAPGDVGVKGVGITGRRYRWPGGPMPFTIDPALPDQKRVRDAIAHWEQQTRMRFVERTAANASAFPNFVEIIPANGCFSQVGMRGGRQELGLAAGCGTGSTIHELGHALGLWHEQSREDRDSFVTIHWANIVPGREHNFNQHISDGEDIGAYDYGSIMHYGPFAFSSTGMPTVEPTQPGVTIGQRNGLSGGDRASIHALCGGGSFGAVWDAGCWWAADGVRDPGLGVHNIAYRDTSGRLHELWRDAQGVTGTTNLTANAGAPAAAGNPFAYLDTSRNTEILLFRGGDGTVRSLYWSTGPVGHDDLGGTAGAPRAAGDPVGYYAAAADTHHVIYRTGDGHLHELWWTGVAPVGYGGDLTAGVSAPPAAGDPSAFVNGAGDNIVVFRSTDGHIRSIYWSTGPSGLDDLSGFAGTPPAAGDPFAYYTAHDDTHQVVYRGGDGHLYELYWPGVAPVVGWDSAPPRAPPRRPARPPPTTAPGRTPSTSSTAPPTAACTRSGGCRAAAPQRMSISPRSPQPLPPRTAPPRSPSRDPTPNTSPTAPPTTTSTRCAGS